MQFPANLRYTAEHEWIKLLDDDTALVGITDFAQGELGDIVYVEVETVGDEIAHGEIFGTIEAVKTTSDLYMPVSGKILEFNKDLDSTEGDNPALVNSDPYENGWIVKIKINDLSDVDKLMDAETYKKSIGK